MLQRQIVLMLIFMGLAGCCLAKPAGSADGTKSLIDKATKTEGLNGANAIEDKDTEFRAKYATQMLSFMNTSVEPCDDFYEYACGNWKNVIDPRQSDHKRDNLLDIAYKLGDIAEMLLQRPHIDDVASEYNHIFTMAKQFYNNCMEAKIFPMQKSEDYLNLIREIGGFPAIDANWSANKFSWVNTSAHLSNYGIHGLLKEDVIPQYPYPPYFQTPPMGLEIELHYDTINNSASNAHQMNRKQMQQILQLYDVPAAKIDFVIDEIFEFLQAIMAVIAKFDEDDEKCSMMTMILEESDIDYLEEFWRAYFEIAWPNTDELFSESDRPCAYLYHHVAKICDKYPEAAANYLAIKLIYEMDAHLKDEKFHKEFCILNIKSSMSFFFDQLYMKLYFNGDIRSDVEAIMKEIRQTMHGLLLEADWLDEATREAALLKEASMAEYIGRYEDPEMIERLMAEYKNLTFVKGNYERNRLSLKKFKQNTRRYNGLHHQQLSNTTKPLDVLLGMQVNAFYYNIDNAIYMMAGVLHPPSFHTDWPQAMKYGTLGFLVGHEVTHGFDTVGANFDSTGNMNNWWSNKSGKVFDERSQCYADHFQNYTIPEINRHINGNLTKNENIADSGGLRIALMAYRRYVKEITQDAESLSSYNKEEQLPGIDVTPEQLFFLSSAQLWCSSYQEAHYWEELSKEHPIDKYRVLGMAANSDDFANVFNCPLGSNMNPVKNKCEIW